MKRIFALGALLLVTIMLAGCVAPGPTALLTGDAYSTGIIVNATKNSGWPCAPDALSAYHVWVLHTTKNGAAAEKESEEFGLEAGPNREKVWSDLEQARQTGQYVQIHYNIHRGFGFLQWCSYSHLEDIDAVQPAGGS